MNEIITFEQSHPIITEYVRSSIITFLSVFLTVLAMNINTLDTGSITISLIASIALTAVRAAIKAVGENLSNKQYPTPITPTVI